MVKKSQQIVYPWYLLCSLGISHFPGNVGLGIHPPIPWEMVKKIRADFTPFLCFPKRFQTSWTTTKLSSFRCCLGGKGGFGNVEWKTVVKGWERTEKKMEVWFHMIFSWKKFGWFWGSGCWFWGVWRFFFNVFLSLRNWLLETLEDYEIRTHFDDMYWYYITWILQSGVKCVPRNNHQKQTWRLNFDTLGGSGTQMTLVLIGVWALFWGEKTFKNRGNLGSR